MICVTFVRAEMRKTQSLGREVLGLGKKLRDPAFAILGHMELAGTAFHLGETTADTFRHFRQAKALYNPGQHRAHLTRFGVDMGLFSRSWATHLLWHAGYADQAHAQGEESLRLADDLAHPFSRAITLAYAAMLHQFCRELERVDFLVEATITLCIEHGFPYYLAWAEVLRGWSRAAAGAPEEGIADIRRGIGVLQATAGARLSYYHGLLAEACGWAGIIDDAFQALADGFAEVQKTEERWWEAELHRIRGELLWSEKVNHRVEAEACFHRAIEIARGQRAKSLELRAAMSLGRLWRDQDRRDDAHGLVAGVYSSFTEGLDTPDLREARSLLDELSEPGRAVRAVASLSLLELSAARPTKKRSRPLT
jgi:predicted ATPase